MHEVMEFSGTVEGDEIEAHYQFVNTGDQALEIEIVSACQCMAIEWTRGPIARGQSGEITVVFDTSDRTGDVTKEIDVIFKNTDQDGYPLVKRVWLRGRIYKRI